MTNSLDISKHKINANGEKELLITCTKCKTKVILVLQLRNTGYYYIKKAED